MYKFKTIRLCTPDDHAKAERLQSQGWKVISVGWNSLLFQKEITCTEAQKHAHGCDGLNCYPR